jgi:hypothetical protein
MGTPLKLQIDSNGYYKHPPSSTKLDCEFWFKENYGLFLLEPHILKP